ncbi:GSCOCG00007716001-RA-CDS [Cotesia congregata]|nr:GSCOCG00007716001-RA-CDS [Cotesia congregata]
MIKRIVVNWTAIADNIMSVFKLSPTNIYRSYAERRTYVSWTTITIFVGFRSWLEIFPVFINFSVYFTGRYIFRFFSCKIL